MMALLASCAGRASGLLLLQQAPARARPAAAAWIRPVASAAVAMGQMTAMGTQRRGLARLAAAASEGGGGNEYFAVIDE